MCAAGNKGMYGNDYVYGIAHCGHRFTFYHGRGAAAVITLSRAL